MRLHLLAAVAPLVLLTACASAGSGPGRGSSELAAGLSPYGMFLAGEAALNDGKNGEAARFFDQARMQSADDAMVSERAFTAALLSGEVDKAAALAPTGDDASEAGKRLGKLVVAIDALADGRAKQAKDMLSGENIAFPHRPAAALVGPWRRRKPATSRDRWCGPRCGATARSTISASSARARSSNGPSATTRPRPTSRRPPR